MSPQGYEGLDSSLGRNPQPRPPYLPSPRVRGIPRERRVARGTLLTQERRKMIRYLYQTVSQNQTRTTAISAHAGIKVSEQLKIRISPMRRNEVPTEHRDLSSTRESAGGRRDNPATEDEVTQGRAGSLSHPSRPSIVPLTNENDAQDNDTSQGEILGEVTSGVQYEAVFPQRQEADVLTEYVWGRLGMERSRMQREDGMELQYPTEAERAEMEREHATGNEVEFAALLTAARQELQTLHDEGENNEGGFDGEIMASSTTKRAKRRRQEDFSDDLPIRKSIRTWIMV